jgi:thiamine pyrophosphate-dependent acetolactate synthase large subunit-like protein
MLEQGLSTKGVVVMDVRVSAEENVYPMIPPGAGLKEMVLR